MPSTLAREACHQPELNVSRRTTRENGLSRGIGVRVGLLFAALFVIAIFVWQGIAAHGAPDPLQAHTTATVASLDIGVLVFREGLECILVLAAVTASMTGPRRDYRKPVMSGAAIAFLATLATWFVAVGIMKQLSENIPALHLQAATGLLAVIVLLVIMNWFFHKIYWGGWIRAHNRRRKSLLDSAASGSRLRWGLILLGFTSLYREGFEVVLFLQSYHLQQRLPYRKMLITTGILLGVVLLVMVGEQAQEMQLANWISATPIPWLTNSIPAWVSLWCAVFPTYETMAAQFLAALIVIGSYYAAKRFGAVPLAGTDSVEEAKRVSIDSGIVKPLQAVR